QASEETALTVQTKLGATEVAHATATAAGGTSSTTTLNTPPLPDAHPITAYATEVSGVGNGEGTSSPPVEFEVDTLAPEVAITKGPKTRSHQTVTSFSGTASEDTAVTVHIKLGEAEIAHATTTAAGGTWST